MLVLHLCSAKIAIDSQRSVLAKTVGNSLGKFYATAYCHAVNVFR